MIPILYLGTETRFVSNGIGRLSECLKCLVTEERNGIYECEFEYPITGRFYKQMVSMVEAYSIGYRPNMGIIGCIHDDRHDIQPFDLYSVSAPIDGIATFNAHHVSYRTNDEIVEPFNASSLPQVIGALPGKIKDGSEFDFWTDKTTTGKFEITVPHNVRELLGGSDGSILDVYGSGEYEFDKFNIKLYGSRGIDSGVTIRYGKNLTNIDRDLDSSDTYNAVAPYWAGTVTEDDGTSEDVTVILDELTVKSSEVSGVLKARSLDLSSEFEEVPTKNELKEKAAKFLSDNKPWLPKDNVKVSFIQLWQTEEYKNVAILQRLSLCDTVSVYYPELGVIAARQKVIRVVYNVLLERYDEMELGSGGSSLSDTISSSLRAEFENDLKRATKDAINDSMLQAAIAHATDLITGGLGGHVVFTLNADGQPEEILIMDTDDINTAVNVWRFNQGGLGHSHNGYNGPFSDVALTMDGSINAYMITTGLLNANLIKVGIIQDKKQYNYWNMETGEFQLKGYATSSDLSNASSNTLSSAKTYADSAANAAYNSAKTYADGNIKDYDTNLTQAKVFNKLTNNGLLKGIYMKDNQLYINASYIYSGTLKLGGNNNVNGLLQIFSADGTETAAMTKDGLEFIGYRIYYDYYSGYLDSGRTSFLPNADHTQFKRNVLLNDGGLYFKYKQYTQGDYEYGSYSEISNPTFINSGEISASMAGLTLFSNGRTVQMKGSGAELQVGHTGSISSLINEVYPGGVRVGGSVRIGNGYDVNFMRTYSARSDYCESPNSGTNYRACVGLHFNGFELDIYNPTYNTHASYSFASDFSQLSVDSLIVDGVGVSGTKSRIVDTADYSTRLLYCYETPTPMFGDLGEGVIDENGETYIFIDAIFEETVETNIAYQVFLQKYGEGECCVSKRTPGYFIVKGTPGLKFGWELKAKQKGFDQIRMEIKDLEERVVTKDYGYIDGKYIKELEDERMNVV